VLIPRLKVWRHWIRLVEARDDKDVDQSPRCGTLAPHTVEDNDSLRGDGVDAIDDPAGATWLVSIYKRWFITHR